MPPVVFWAVCRERFVQFLLSLSLIPVISIFSTPIVSLSFLRPKGNLPIRRPIYPSFSLVGLNWRVSNRSVPELLLDYASCFALNVICTFKLRLNRISCLSFKIQISLQLITIETEMISPDFLLTGFREAKSCLVSQGTFFPFRFCCLYQRAI